MYRIDWENDCMSLFTIANVTAMTIHLMVLLDRTMVAVVKADVKSE
jgi:hypothetical protein